MPAARIAPLVLATTTSQALLVVLAPTVVAVAAELRTSVAVAGQARTVTAGVAVVVSLLLTRRIEAVGVPRLLRGGAALTIGVSGAVAAAPNLVVFLLAHVLVGVALAALLTAGFAGVAGFSGPERAWAIGHVAGANALAWIIVNPVAGAVTEWLSWRAAHAVPAALAVATLILGRRLRPGRQQADVPLRALVADRNARRWIGAELLAYGCWTALLTFVGAFFIQTLAVDAATAGWLLAAGAAAFFAASTRSGRLVARVARRRLVAAAAVAMAALGLALLALRLGVVPAVVLFCLVGVAAGVRTPISSGLALELLPGQAGAMMAIRSAVTQLGYLLGAAVGGALLAAWGYAALGVMVAVGMTVSGLLVLRVREPSARP